MSATFDAASNSGYVSASATATWAHACAGSNRDLRVYVSMLSVAGSTVSGITFNGVALTKIGSKASVSGACRVEEWQLVAPATGSHNVVVTLSAALDFSAAAVSYSGARQAAPEASASASATNVGAADATVDVAVVTPGSLVGAVVASDDGSISVGAGQTSRSNVTGAAGSGASSTEPAAAAGTVTMSWTGVGALATWSIFASTIGPAAAGEVEFLGTISGSAAATAEGTDGKAKAADGDFTTHFASGSADCYFARDLGAAAILTQVMVTPRAEAQDGSPVGTGGQHFTIEGSNTSATAGLVTLFTAGNVPFLYRSRQNIVGGADSGGVAYEWYRLRSSVNMHLAEIRFFGTHVTGVSARPKEPVISPWGRKSPTSAAVSVTLSSGTTTSNIFYTTDGSTPTASSTQYTVPFNVTPSAAGVTVKAIAIDAGLSTTDSLVSAAVFKLRGIRQGDDSPCRNATVGVGGIEMDIHGGSIWSRAGVYYRTGFSVNRSDTGSNVFGSGARLASSSDLLNWSDLGQICGLHGSPTLATQLERCHILPRPNPITGKWVAWVTMYGGSIVAGTKHVFTSDTLAPANTGYTLACDEAGITPLGLGINDFTLFLDADGRTAYIVGPKTTDSTKLVIARLTSRWTDCDGTYIEISMGSGREAPTLALVGSTYFLLTSGGNFYDPASTYDVRYITGTGGSTPLACTWSAMPGTIPHPFDPFTGSDQKFSTQCTSLFPLITGGWALWGDCWRNGSGPGHLSDTRDTILPVVFPTATTMFVPLMDEWTPGDLLPTHRQILATQPSHLKAFWRMIEASGDLLDATGNAKTLTAHSLSAYRATGKQGFGVSFDGAASYADRASSVLGAAIPATWTQQVFVNGAAASDKYFFGVGTVAGNGPRMEMASGTSDTSKLRGVGVAAGPAVDVNDEGGVILDNSWHQAAFRYTGSAFQLVVDGVQALSVTHAQGGYTALDTTTIGAAAFLGNAASNLFAGSLQLGAMWDTNLSTAELAAIWTAAASSDTDAPTAVLVAVDRATPITAASPLAFSVIFTDPSLVVLDSVNDSGTVYVVDPDGVTINPDVDGVDAIVDSLAITVTYILTPAEIIAAAGRVKAGTYSVKVIAATVSDTSGNKMSAQTIGTLHVSVPQAASGIGLSIGLTL